MSVIINNIKTTINLDNWTDILKDIEFLKGSRKEFVFIDFSGTNFSKLSSDIVRSIFDAIHKLPIYCKLTLTNCKFDDKDHRVIDELERAFYVPSKINGLVWEADVDHSVLTQLVRSWANTQNTNFNQLVIDHKKVVPKIVWELLQDNKSRSREEGRIELILMHGRIVNAPAESASLSKSSVRFFSQKTIPQNGMPTVEPGKDGASKTVFNKRTS